jgi:Domain of unknown function (DUF1772)
MIGQLALITAGLFAGAAIFVNVAEQPARLALDDRALLLEWQRSYTYAAPMQSGLALVSCVFGLYAAWQSRDPRWILGAVLIVANWPYTIFVIKPTNDRLHATAAEKGNVYTREMIMAWGRLHAWRSVLGVAATLGFLWASY